MTEYEKIKVIYDLLQDESSKKIFGKRLLYSLSGDKQYLNMMVDEEMEALKSDDILCQCLEWISSIKNKKVSVFGAGFAGLQVVTTLKRHGINLERIYDNDPNKWGKKLVDVEICFPNYITKDELIILAVNYHREEILKQIKATTEEKNIFVPSKLWWLGKYPQYFDKDIFGTCKNEIFIDGGSLDGGDSINFVKWCAGDYEKIYAFEPDKDNINKMQGTASKLENFQICPVGMWSKEDTLKFTSGKKENSFISKEGNCEIKVNSIDNILNGNKATFIKMDIEGSEIEALRGAEQTIKKYSPKLAICVYHKPEDIIDIPQMILNINPNYKFWLRHYSYVDTETVLYASV